MNISTKLLRIARMAKEHPKRAFTNLAHYIDLDFLREAHRLTRKDGATGVDGVTAQNYERHLEENLQDLLNRFKAGSYRAPDVRRVHIPKGPGRTRPIGIPTFEDKVLQRAVAMILGAVYEQDFMSCSYGFRPRRSAHDALSTIRQGLMDLKGGWVVEADIRNCFGAFDRRWMRKILGRRIRDGVLIRQIGKWLNAGVMEQGQRTRPKAGTPQGRVISPILANVYLHDVLDVWFERGVRPYTRGHAQLVRYADDFVILCEHESDAQRIYAALSGRFGHFGLELHPEKTRLIPFKKPPYRSDGGGNDTESWNFLGFTHYWTKSRRGYWVIAGDVQRGELVVRLRVRIHALLEQPGDHLRGSVAGGEVEKRSPVLVPGTEQRAICIDPRPQGVELVETCEIVCGEAIEVRECLDFLSEDDGGRGPEDKRGGP